MHPKMSTYGYKNNLFVSITNIACGVDNALYVFIIVPMDVSSIYKRLGPLIRERRQQLGLTQKRLSSQLGISRASLANIETGRQRVLLHQLYGLADKLNVRVEALLPEPEENKEVRTPDGLFFSENISPEQQQQIVNLLLKT